MGWGVNGHACLLTDMATVCQNRIKNNFTVTTEKLMIDPSFPLAQSNERHDSLRQTISPFEHTEVFLFIFRDTGGMERQGVKKE